MRTLVIATWIPLALSACDKAQVEPKTQQSLIQAQGGGDPRFGLAIADAAALPSCSATVVGRLVYVVGEKQFAYCNAAAQWERIGGAVAKDVVPASVAAASGVAGAPGEKGEPGATGANGADGLAGAAGAAGPAGAAGADGSVGAKGDKGDAGDAAFSVTGTTASHTGTLSVQGDENLVPGLAIAASGCSVANLVQLDGAPNLAGVLAGDVLYDTAGTPLVVDGVDADAKTLSLAGTCADNGTLAPVLRRNAASFGEGYVGIGTARPTSPLQIASGAVSLGTTMWGGIPEIDVPFPLMTLGWGFEKVVKTNTGIRSLLHLRSWTPYRGHDSGTSLSFGPHVTGGEDSMTARVVASTDVGNSHGSRLGLQTTRSAKGWNPGLGVWENGTVTVNRSFLGVEPRTTTFSVLGIAGMPIFELHAPTTGVLLARFTEAGRLGIGVADPKVSLDLAGEVKLPVRSAAPTACTASLAGTIALSSFFRLCACDGAAWVETTTGGACDWD